MDERDKYRADGFIARWLAGELACGENQAFEQWLQSNPVERQYFEELKTIWSHYGSIELADRLSKAERWHQIRERLSRESGL